MIKHPAFEEIIDMFFIKICVYTIYIIMRIVNHDDLVIGTLYYIEKPDWTEMKLKHKGIFIGYNDDTKLWALFKNVEKMPGISSRDLPYSKTIPTFEMNERPLINGRRSRFHDVPYTPWKHARGHWTYYLPEIEEIEQNRLNRLYEDATNQKLREITGDPSFFYFKRPRAKGGKTKRKNRRTKKTRKRVYKKGTQKV
jgi:hypothetical protein